MKQIFSFLAMLLLTPLFWGTASAADYDNDVTFITASPADGSADVWYHIVLPVRTYGIWGRTGFTNDSYESRGFYCDQGIGKLLINVEDTLDIPGTRWKFVETATADRYRLISGLGNTLDCSPKLENIGTEGQPGFIPMDRIYTTTLSTQYVTISTRTAPNGTLAVAGLRLSRPNNTSGGGVDKTGSDLNFDGNYGPDSYGGAVLFRPAIGTLDGPYLFPAADLDFDKVPTGKARTKTLTVKGMNLSGTLEYSVSGEGFSIVAGESTATGGTAEITFSPTEVKAYTATLTISIGDLSETITLTGNALSEFPIQTGDNNWYYIQFDRQAVNNKVLQENGLASDITQKLINGGEDKQLWKITGDWDDYHIVSKSGVELFYNTASNKYITDEEGYGNAFSFDPFADTDGWQLRNITSGYKDTTDVESETRRYLNDYDAKGDSVGNYTANDAGNRLIFIPSTTQAVIAGLETADFGSVPTGVEAAATKMIPVGGLNITGNISAAIGGAGAAAFSLTAATLPATGGTLEVTFTPPSIDIYKATLVLSAEGVENDTVQLTARGSVFPFKLSDDTAEYWYYIQFMRRPALALTKDTATVGADVTQTLWTQGQPVNDAQIWKITGSWDNFKFVSKKGGELSSVPAPTTEEPNKYGNYKVVESGAGSRHIAVERTTGTYQGWCFQHVEAKEAGRTLYINDYEGETVALYGYLDDGDPLKFIPVSEGPVITPSTTTLTYNDVITGLKSESTLTVRTDSATASVTTYIVAGSGASAFKVTNTTAGAGANDPLPVGGGTLKVSFEPEAIGEYVATLTLSSEGADDVIVVLVGYSIPYSDDFPVKISDETSTTWYTVYFDRRYTSATSYKVWTAGLESEAIKQTTHTGRTDASLTSEEQLWKFVVSPSKTNYLAVSYSGLVAVTGGVADGNADFTLEDPTATEGTSLIFKKNSSGKWVLIDAISGGRALNDRGGNTICEYDANGNDGGNPLGFLETTPPDLVRIQLYTAAVNFGKIESGAPALYSGNVIVKGYRLGENNIAVSVTGEDVSAYTIIRSADSSAVASLSPAGDTLKVIFAPTAAQAYPASLTFTAEGATSKTIALTGGGDVQLPVAPSTAAEPVWRHIGFVRQSPLFTTPKTYTKVLTADAESDTLRQVEQESTVSDAQLWRLEGTPAEGYRLINKAANLEAFYDSTSTVKAYFLKPAGVEGDRFSFVSGVSEADAAKIQLRNLTNTSNGGYLCDKENKGFYAINYSRNDGGNWLFFTPPGVKAVIVPVDVEANDPVTSSVYYSLQGIRVLRPVKNNIYIRIDKHVSGKTTATKIISKQ